MHQQPPAQLTKPPPHPAHPHQMVYSDISLKGHFAVEAAMRYNSEGERIRQHPHDSDLWLKYQEETRNKLVREGVLIAPEKAVMAALQVYSDKTQVNKKGVMPGSIVS